MAHSRRVVLEDVAVIHPAPRPIVRDPAGNGRGLTSRNLVRRRTERASERCCRSYRATGRRCYVLILSLSLIRGSKCALLRRWR
jgi:hypothetical protein